jgi:hypothetical protein
MKKVKIKIVALFAVIFLAGFIPEKYPTAFGDWKCKGSGEKIVSGTGWDATYHYAKCNFYGYHNPKYHWGFRHYLWLTLGLTLTAISVYQIVEEYDNK